jgi:hypothetical protein
MAVGLLVSNILVLVTEGFLRIGGRPAPRNKYFGVIEQRSFIYDNSIVSRYLHATYGKIVLSEEHHLSVGIAHSPVRQLLVPKGMQAL